jgi:hypothetical protein
MKKSQFTDQQIALAVQQAEAEPLACSWTAGSQIGTSCGGICDLSGL